MVLRHSVLISFIPFSHFKLCKLEPCFNTAHRVHVRVYQLACVCLQAIEHLKLNLIRTLSSPTRSLGHVRLDQKLRDAIKAQIYTCCSCFLWMWPHGGKNGSAPLDFESMSQVEGRWAKGQKRTPACCLFYNLFLKLLSVTSAWISLSRSGPYCQSRYRKAWGGECCSFLDSCSRGKGKGDCERLW